MGPQHWEKAQKAREGSLYHLPCGRPQATLLPQPGFLGLHLGELRTPKGSSHPPFQEKRDVSFIE